MVSNSKYVFCRDPLLANHPANVQRFSNCLLYTSGHIKSLPLNEIIAPANFIAQVCMEGNFHEVIGQQGWIEA